MTSTLAPRRRPLTAALLASLVLAGCGSDQPGAGVDPASLAPAGSVMYAEATVRPGEDQLEALNSVGRKITGRDDVAVQLERAVSTITDGDVEFGRDLEPWIGDRVALALTGVRDGGASSGEPAADGALIAQATDTEAALAALRRLTADQGTPRDASHAGTDYTQVGDAAYGIVEESVVVGSDAGFKAVVDAAAGDGLAAEEDFERTRDAVAEDRLAFLYVDARRTAELLAASGQADEMDADTLRQVLGGDGVRAFGAALHLRSDAVLVDTAALGGRAPAADPAELVASFPAGSWLAVGFGDVGESLRRALDGARRLGGSGGAGIDEGLRQAEAALGLDVEEDLLSWMGETGLFARGTSISDVGGALVVRTKDADKTRAALDRLRTLAAGAGTVEDLSGPGIDAGLQVSPAGAPVQLLAALSGDRFVLALNRSALDAAIRADRTLADDPAFQAGADLLGDGMEPSLFVDLRPIVTWAGLALGSDPSFQQAKRYLDAFTVVVAGSSRDGDLQRGRLAIGVR